MKKVLEVIKKEIEKEMQEVGFLEDSDNTERTYEALISSMIEDEDNREEAEKEIRAWMLQKYKKYGSCDKTAHYAGCFYKNSHGLKRWLNK
jgi:hypothetical protein